MLNVVSGLGLLIASVAAGTLWDRVGSGSMFLAAIIPALGALMVICLGRKKTGPGSQGADPLKEN
jgi:hypothetical protein